MTKSSVNKHRLAQARAASENMFFLLHCDGINLKDVKQKSCAGKIFVPMLSMRSVEEMHITLKAVDWRVSFAKVPVADGEARNAAFAQCTDCWIEFYRDMVKDAENKEELFAQVDPEGKFLDRLRGA